MSKYYRAVRKQRDTPVHIVEIEAVPYGATGLQRHGPRLKATGRIPCLGYVMVIQEAHVSTDPYKAYFKYITDLEQSVKIAAKILAEAQKELSDAPSFEDLKIVDAITGDPTAK